MAPEDTSTTWDPAATRPATASTRASSRFGSSPPAEVVNDDESTLTTMTLARPTARRAADSAVLTAPPVMGRRPRDRFRPGGARQRPTRDGAGAAPSARPRRSGPPDP